MRSIILALALLGAASPAFAQKGKCGGDQKEKTKYVKEVAADGTVVYRITSQFLVCGTVPHPSVLYGILNSTINYEWENLKQDFLAKVIQSVDQSPF
jgi:hypothetical protein